MWNKNNARLNRVFVGPNETTEEHKDTSKPSELLKKWNQESVDRLKSRRMIK